MYIHISNFIYIDFFYILPYVFAMGTITYFKYTQLVNKERYQKKFKLKTLKINVFLIQIHHDIQGFAKETLKLGSPYWTMVDDFYNCD